VAREEALQALCRHTEQLLRAEQVRTRARTHAHALVPTAQVACKEPRPHSCVPLVTA
jgi:hypothetical protein